MVASIAKEFGVLPSAVARDLDADPRQISKACLLLLRYAEAKSAFDSAKNEDALKAWRGVKAMEEVRRNTKVLSIERRARMKAKREARR